MKTLLVLDDESSVIRLVRQVLKEYALIEANTAEEAIRLFMEHSREIDLLLADVTLPTSSGIQVASILRIEIPDLPVILTSGYGTADWCDRDCADLKRVGQHTVTILHKPFQPQVLRNTVRQLIGLPPPELARNA